MTQADEEKRPPGLEEIVQVDVSPLLNCPVPVRDTKIVAPGGCGEAGAKAITGVPSRVKEVVAVSPRFPVTVMLTMVFVATEAPTVNAPVTFPPPTLHV